MKKITISVIVVMVCIAFISLSAQCSENKPYEKPLFDRATMVLRVKNTSGGIGSKYSWYHVEILETFKAPQEVPPSKTIKVAALGIAPGVPIGVSTIYLEQFRKDSFEHWKLLDADGNVGVSHVQEPERDQ